LSYIHAGRLCNITVDYIYSHREVIYKITICDDIAIPVREIMHILKDNGIKSRMRVCELKYDISLENF